MYNQIVFIALLSLVSFLPVQMQNIDAQSASKSVAKGEMFTLKSGNLTMIIDPNTGSRVVSLKLDGEEILGTNELNSRYYGSTLWLAPQGKWKGQGILNDSSYSLEYFNGENLSLRSLNDSLRGFSFSKEFHVSHADTSIVLEYSIKNISKDMQQVAPWEVTRVPTGGLAFIPKGSHQNMPTPNKRLPLLMIRDTIGTIWCPYDSSSISAQKIFMEGSEGWLAYVRNRVLFIKEIPVIKSFEAAPGEKNVEVYVNKEKTYMELENQGIYQKLMAGDSLVYKVKWYARRLPDGIKVEVGNVALLDYVRSVIKKE